MLRNKNSGVVHTDLLRQGLIDDPYIGLNEREVQWVDKEDWVYEKTFSADNAILDDDHIDLCFDGLDTYADVFLNGSKILEADKFVRALALSIDGTEDYWLSNNYFDLLPGVPIKCFVRTTKSPSEVKQRLTYRSL